jgi:hypothetical protein
MTPSKVIKIGDAIKMITVNAISYYGIEYSLFITLTLKGGNSMETLSRKCTALFKYLPKSVVSAIAVFGSGHKSSHVHLVAFIRPLPSNAPTGPLKRKAGPSGNTFPQHLRKIRSLIIKAKTKAGFGRVCNVQFVRNAEAVGGYLRRNYLDLDEYRHRAGPSLGSKFRYCRYHRLPRHLIIKPNQFSRHTESSSRYRQAMSGLARCVGTPEGDVAALEAETGLSFEELRTVAFGLCNTTPGKPPKWSQEIYAKALAGAGSLHNQFKAVKRIINYEKTKL